jgi:hypothetical protein
MFYDVRAPPATRHFWYIKRSTYRFNAALISRGPSTPRATKSLPMPTFNGRCACHGSAQKAAGNNAASAEMLVSDFVIIFMPRLGSAHPLLIPIISSVGDVTLSCVQLSANFRCLVLRGLRVAQTWVAILIFCF